MRKVSKMDFIKNNLQNAVITNAVIVLVTLLWFPLFFILDRETSLTVIAAIFFMFFAVTNTIFIIVKTIEYFNQDLYNRPRYNNEV